MNSDTIFERVQHAYDLERLHTSRVMYVGTGGAAGFIEDMARAGVGEHVLIDFDVVTAPNLATQQTYLGDLGKPKVNCIAERIKQINPDARVDVYQEPLQELTDGKVGMLTDAPLFFPWHGGARGITANPEPEITLLCGFTDNFYAQARVHRLALQFGIPSLCAQLYKEGRAAEITFTYPGVTPACHRCILRPRYRAYLEHGYQHTASSGGVPIFATTRINALCGFLAMALLHHGTNHSRWGDMLARIGNRTLVQIRMHPDGPLTVFDRVFAGAETDRIFFDEAVWLPQEAVPSCPDCGGTGDLRKAKGTFQDTRLMKQS